MKGSIVEKEWENWLDKVLLACSTLNNVVKEAAGLAVAVQ